MIDYRSQEDCGRTRSKQSCRERQVNKEYTRFFIAKMTICGMSYIMAVH